MIVSPFLQAREQFPSLSRVYHADRLVYLDGPAGSQVPWSVAEAIQKHLAS